VLFRSQQTGYKHLIKHFIRGFVAKYHFDTFSPFFIIEKHSCYFETSNQVLNIWLKHFIRGFVAKYYFDTFSPFFIIEKHSCYLEACKQILNT